MYLKKKNTKNCSLRRKEKNQQQYWTKYSSLTSKTEQNERNNTWYLSNSRSNDSSLKQQPGRGECETTKETEHALYKRFDNKGEKQRKNLMSVVVCVCVLAAGNP